MSVPALRPAGTSPLPAAWSPPVNGGVIGLMPAASHGLGGPPRFDKYEATVFQPNQEVISTLKRKWWPRNCTWEEKPFKTGNYEWILQGSRWEPEVAVKYGGKQPNPWVGSYAGVTSPMLAGLVRQWPHKCTTVDVKFDLQGEGVFDYCYGVVDRIRSKCRSAPEVEKWIDPDGVRGNSAYFGSTQSGFRLCIYEKSKQLKTVKGIIVPDHIVRVEGRFKPRDRDQGVVMSKLTPEEFWATSRWGCAVFNELIGLSIDPITLPRHETLGDDASALAMMAQYLQPLRRLKEREGGWENLGLYLEALQDEAEELLRQRREPQKARNAAAKNR